MYQFKDNSAILIKILDTLPSSIYLKDLQGHYIWLNKSSIKQLEYKHLIIESIVDKTDFDVFPKASAEIYTKNDQKVVQTKQGICTEEDIILPDGRKLIQLSFKEPLFNDDSSIIGILGYTIDITEVKRLEERINEIKISEARFKTMSAVGGMIAHELRTPLTALGMSAVAIQEALPLLIEGYEQSVADGKVKPIRKDRLESLKKSVSHMERSINYAQTTITTVLASFQYGENSEKIPVSPLSLSRVVADAVATYPFDVDEDHLVLIEHIDDVEVLSDRQMLMHVIHNLLKNALHAIDAEGRGSIKIWSKLEKKKVRLYVEDTARGIEPECLTQIFDAFYTTKEKSAVSIGLGLYFCKMVLQKMGGDITCDSQYGKYARFEISLALAK